MGATLVRLVGAVHSARFVIQLYSQLLDLRQKIIFASQEDDSGLKYDPALVQNMFLNTMLTGLQHDRIQSDLQPFLSDPTVSDEVLLERLNVKTSFKTEKN